MAANDADGRNIQHQNIRIWGTFALWIPERRGEIDTKVSFSVVAPHFLSCTALPKCIKAQNFLCVDLGL